MRKKGNRQQSPAPVPIRRGKVMAHLQAWMEHLDGDPDDDELYRRLNETGRGLTQAEHGAVHEALKRNGYG